MFLAEPQFYIADPGCDVKMYVYNIRLELQMEIEQRYVVSYLHRKGTKLPAIVAELTAVYHEDAFDESRMKYWPHEIKLHRSDLSDRTSSGRSLLKISMLEFSKSWELSHGIRFNRSLSSSRFLRRRCISI
jgi:hypothetical protein